MLHLDPTEPRWPLPVDELPHARLEQVRVAPVRTVEEWGFATAIGKEPVDGPVHVGPLGLDGDQQTTPHHGGPDRAVLQYAADHYADWRDELPQAADRLVEGSFGENLVARGMHEWNMCLGDVVEVGSARLQVSELRSPCYKLNAQFAVPAMARFTQASGRTGWLYRVLQEGTIQAGDEIRVVERPLPQWPLARVEHYLYDDPANLEASRQLAALPELAATHREKFARRAESGAVEDWSGRLGTTPGELGSDARTWQQVEVAAVEHPSPRILVLRLAAVDGELPRWRPGAHVSVQVANGSWVHDYSLCGRPDEPGWTLAIGLGDDPSAPGVGQRSGGARHLHRHAAVGDRLVVSEPVNHFPLHRRATRHLFLAGGIGVTPFLPMAWQLGGAADWELHLCVRDSADAALADELSRAHPGRVHVWDSSKGSRLDMAALLATAESGTHVYGCGSGRFLEGIRAATAHWSPRQVHFEAFQPVVAPEQAFEAAVAGTDEVVEVAAGTTLLQALRRAGHRVPSDCETGSCATCTLRFDGQVEHHDLVLTAQQREQEMCSCVSRGIGRITVELPAQG